jgi:hypothetical protein
MASVPYEKAVGELCSKCRPVSLGLQPHLRSFEVLGGGGKGKGKEEGEDGEEKDWGVEGGEIKKDVKALEQAFRGLDIKDTIEAGNVAKDKRRKDSIEKSSEETKNEEKPKTEQTEPAAAAEKEEQPAIDITAPAPDPGSETTNMTTEPSFLKTILNLFKPDDSSPFFPALETNTQPTKAKAKAKATTTSAQNQPSNTDPETWISIPQDPDWETVTSEEKKEVGRKLWKDKGEWIKVNSTQEKIE